MSHPQDLGLRAQAAAIAAGDLDPRELLDATLARIEERDRPLNSTPVVFAEEASQMLGCAPDGPLHGVPVTVKDMFSLPWRGARNATPSELLAPSASGAFRRLRDAGAVVVGIANQHALGAGTTGHLSAYGAHANPWDHARSPGGSSGGSAAGVAARLVAGSLGSDSGGSARIPAACCGVTGLKLTYGGVPRDGYTGAATSLSAWGAIARDADDTRLLTEALLASELPASDAAALRVGVVRSPYWDDCDPQVAARCQELLDVSGWTVREIDLATAPVAQAAGLVRTLTELLGATPPDVLATADVMVRAMSIYARTWPASLLLRADRVRAQLRRELAAAFEHVDLIAWPTMPAVAPESQAPVMELPSGTVPADAANVRQATVANLAGLPAISVPAGLAHGLPVGLQLQAAWGREGLLLDAAQTLEQATGREHVERRP